MKKLTTEQAEALTLALVTLDVQGFEDPINHSNGTITIGNNTYDAAPLLSKLYPINDEEGELV